MLQQKLGSLEAFRQVFFNRFLNHTWACKADKCARLGKINIAQHGKRRLWGQSLMRNKEHALWQVA